MRFSLGELEFLRIDPSSIYELGCERFKESVSLFHERVFEVVLSENDYPGSCEI
jgi:hypothetical protein